MSCVAETVGFPYQLWFFEAARTEPQSIKRMTR